MCLCVFDVLYFILQNVRLLLTGAAFFLNTGKTTEFTLFSVSVPEFIWPNKKDSGGGMQRPKENSTRKLPMWFDFGAEYFNYKL